MRTQELNNIKYIDGIRPPQPKSVNPIQIQMDFNSASSVQIKNARVQSSTVSRSLAKTEQNKSNDFYAQVATRAWSTSSTKPLRRSVKQHAKSYLDDMKNIRQTSLVLEEVEDPIEEAYERMSQNYLQKSLKHTKKSATYLASKVKVLFSEKSLLIISVCQFLIIGFLAFMLINTRSSFADYKVSSQAQFTEMSNQYDTQWKELQTQWQNTLNESR